MNKRKPRIVTVLGDPAGIGPELVGRLLADPATSAQADLLVLADAAELQRGMDLAGQRTAVQRVASLDDADFSRTPTDTPLLVDFRGDTRGEFQRGVSTAAGGRYSLDTLALGLRRSAARARPMRCCSRRSTSTPCTWPACTPATSCTGSPSS